VAITGKWAIVFRATVGSQEIALRCFTREAYDLGPRYRALHAYLAGNWPRYLVDFAYQDDEILIRGQRYPVLEMTWAEGQSLDTWVSQHLGRTGDLAALATKWLEVVTDLERRGLAHGDLANGNCLVNQYDFTLIDYDDFFVPGLAGLPPRGVGFPDFQHAGRRGHYGPDMDAFPALVVYLSLMALESDGSLWQRYHTGENLIFSANDYASPRNTQIWQDLAGNRDPGIRRLTAVLADMCEAPVDSLPPLSRVAGRAILPPLLAGAAADMVPEPGMGRVRAADRLGIAVEVEMLVSILLARDTQLPLAVGLFGGWGSGKSFFMALMSERISELAELAAKGRSDAAPFCRQVRQVRFNAWHYADADLWASLAATIFDELASADAPDRAQATLDALAEARDEAKAARRKCDELERQVQALEMDTNRVAWAVRGSLSTAILAVRDKPLVKNLKVATLETDGGRESHADGDTAWFVTALGEIEASAGTTAVAWRLFQEEVVHRRRWATWITLALLAGLATFTSIAANWPAGLKLLTFIGAMTAGLSPALTGAVQLLYLARKARIARELPLQRKKQELARARAEAERAEQDVVQRENQLAEIRDKGLRLRNFVRERAASPDYRDKLGVISQVRRDFEQLVAMIAGSSRAEATEATASYAASGPRIPEVDRIVLFVDDLDRCPPNKVVEVLQAVHLLLAFKLFVVVVGVDSGWLERSLLTHYRGLLIEPEGYLEKVFQIPFMLRQMTQPGYRGLIDELTLPQGQPAQPSGVTQDGEPAPAISTEADYRTSAVPGIADEKQLPASEVTSPARTGLVPPPRPEALVITDAERDMLGHLSTLVQTPRAAKRLVNIYRMLRVSVPEDELEQFRPGGGNEYQAVALLIGILVGRPSRAHSVFTELMAAEDDSDTRKVFARFEDLRQPLALIGDSCLMSITSYRRWVPRVSRFTFRLAPPLPQDQPSA
jgi:KAP family P-loop domain